MGTAPLRPRQTFAAGNGPRSVTTGDFNGDGLTDLATANQFPTDVSVLLNQCGSSSPVPTLPEGTKLLDGVLVGGLVADLFASDDQYFELDPSPTKNPAKQKIHLIVQSTSPSAAPQDFRFRVESVMLGGPSGDVIQKIELRNYATVRWSCWTCVLWQSTMSRLS